MSNRIAPPRWNRATTSAILTYLIRNVRFVARACQPSNPNQVSSITVQSVRGEIPRSLRSCSFNYLAVSALFLERAHARESPTFARISTEVAISLTLVTCHRDATTGIDRRAKCSSNESAEHTREVPLAELYINTRGILLPA